MTALPDIIAALDHLGLFKGMFDGPSWTPWKVFLKALFALPMDDADLPVFQHFTHRTDAPSKPFRSATLVCGRRGGKSRILGLVAAYLAAVLDHDAYLVHGEVAVVAIIAADRRQARIILGYVLGTLRAAPALSDMIDQELADSVRLTNGVQIEIHTGSIGAPRGRTFLAVLCDETAFWPTGDSANPDVEVINAVRPGLSTIPYSLLLVASSPYAKRGVLYNNYSRYFGKDAAPVLVWQGSTEEMNATLVDDPLIAEMYAEDNERACAEFGAIFRSDIVAFITREAIEDCLARGVRELPASSAITYVGFCDPSGGSADSFTLAIAHMESDGTAVLDAVREVRPPFSPDGVVEEYAALLKSYGITRVTGDAYAGEWPRERFSVHGISYDVSKRSKNVIYSEFLPALNGRRVRLLDLPRLTGQLVSLERRTARGGRDSVDHAPGSHDDVANSSCGALTLIISDRRPGLVKQADLLGPTGAGVRPPFWVLSLFAVVAISLEGMAATVYIGLDRENRAYLLDYDLVPLPGGLFADVVARLAELAIQVPCRAGGVSLWVQPGLARIAEVAVPNLIAQEIPLHLIDSDDLLLPCTSHVGAGSVLMCSAAVKKSETLPFPLDFKGGDTTDNPLRRAILWGVSLALDPRPSVRRRT